MLSFYCQAQDSVHVWNVTFEEMRSSICSREKKQPLTQANFKKKHEHIPSPFEKVNVKIRNFAPMPKYVYT